MILKEGEMYVVKQSHSFQTAKSPMKCLCKRLKCVSHNMLLFEIWYAFRLTKYLRPLALAVEAQWLKPCHFLWFQFSVFQKQQIKRRFPQIRHGFNPPPLFFCTFGSFLYFFCFMETLVLRFSFAAHTNAGASGYISQTGWWCVDLTVPLVWFAAGRTQMWWMPGGCFNKTHKKNTSDWIWVGLL